jgi:hypothetical protein
MATTNTLPDATAGLYNALCSGLKLSNQQFQMIQGVLPILCKTPDDAADLYNFFDGIPPKSVSTLYTGNPVNGLNGNMQNVLSDSSDTTSFVYTLANKNFMNTNYWIGGAPGVNPIYTPTLSNLLALVAAGSSAVVNFDSQQCDTDISTSWAQSASSAGVGFWGTQADSVSASFNKMASSSRITVSISIDKFAYLPTRPGGWFSQGFFTRQYKNPTTNWIGGRTTWDTLFGPTGSCQFLPNQVMLVNGYSIAVRSYANYQDIDFSTIKASSQTNVWPFYVSSSNSQATQSFVHNEDHSISINVTCNPGNTLQILGMGVIPTSLAMGGPSASASRLI